MKLEEDTLETRTRTFYESHFGPIVNLKDVSELLDGWPMFNGKLLTMRDANLLQDTRGVDQYIAMGRSQSMAEFTEALKSIGIPVFHTLAADRDGEAKSPDRTPTVTRWARDDNRRRSGRSPEAVPPTPRR